MALQQNDILEVLKGVLYPKSTQNIIEMDMVQQVRIEGKKLSFTLVTQKSNDPNNIIIKANCVQIIKKTFGDQLELAGNITIKSIHDMERPILPEVKNIIAVASGKGGVGKSTVSVNLAVALAKTGAKVGLIDADIYGPSIPKMFSEEDAQPSARKVGKRDLIIPVEKYGVKILSIGFFVDQSEALIWRGPMASNALKQLIVDSDWGALDYLLIDLPPGTSDIHLTMVQTVPVTGAVIVTTPQDVALADVIKGVNMFKSKTIDVPVLGLIENMAWFTPEELPENKYYIFGKNGGKKMAEELNIPLLGQIPIVQGIREGGDKGLPIAYKSESISASAFSNIAIEVQQAIDNRNNKMDKTEKVKISKR